MITISKHAHTVDGICFEDVDGTYKTMDAAMKAAKKMAGGRKAQFVTFGRSQVDGKSICGFAGPAGTYEINR